MMVNNNYSSRGTEESYKKHLKTHLIINSAMLMTGVMFLIWVNAASWNSTHEQDYTQGVFWGMGISFIALSVARLIRIIRCMKNPKAFQKAYTEHVDERNQFVLMRTYYVTTYIFIILMALSVIVVVFMGMPPVISQTIATCIGAFGLILTITYRIMKRKY